jgi:hypothetical protein
MNTPRPFNGLVIITLMLLTLLPGTPTSAWAATNIELAPVGSPPDPIFSLEPVNYEAKNKPLTVTQASNQTWLQLSPTGAPPAPRYWAGNAYDEVNDRLILFSGEDPGPLPRLTDVWVLTNASGVGGMPSWIELAPTGASPLGREGGTVVYDPTSNRIIVHAGCGGHCSPALPDVWVLTNANDLGGTPTWISLPDAPVGRAGHSAVYDPGSNRMIVLGGNQAFAGTDRNDVWILTDANGLGAPTWIQLSPTGAPPSPRTAHMAIYDQVANRMIVFGGNACCTAFFNDVWILTHANGLGGTPEWLQLMPIGPPPAPRANHSLVYDPTTNQIIVFGGLTSFSPYTIVNDVWVLTNANGMGGTPQWTQRAPGGGPIPARLGHSVGYSATSKRMIVAMGYNDQVSPNFFNDAWALNSELSAIYLPVIFKPEPLTHLYVQSINTGGINPFEIRDPNNGDALLLRCVIGNNVTQFCGSFKAITTYKVVAYPANCPPKAAIFNDALPGATVTRVVICQ